MDLVSGILWNAEGLLNGEDDHMAAEEGQGASWLREIQEIAGNYSTAYGGDEYSSYYYANGTATDAETYSLSWGGSILFILCVDAIAALIAFAAFLVVRHAALKEYDEVVSLEGLVTRRKRSTWKIKRLIDRVFYRHSERKLEEPRGWFNWIWATVRVNDAQILECCGRDGYLYLSFQRYLMYSLLVQSLIACPFLLGVNVLGSNAANSAGFGITTTNHVASGSPLLWMHTGATVLISVLMAVSIYLTVRSIRSYASMRDIHMSARLFTAKISNFPLSITDVAELQEYFDTAYPGQVIQCYICFDLNKLSKLYKRLRQIEGKINHYELMWTATGKRPTIFKNQLLRLITCESICSSSMDALMYYYAKKAKYERKVDTFHQKERKQIATGVCFATFAKAAECRQFITDYERRRDQPVTHLDKKLETRYWRVQRAPQYEDIRWSSLHVHTPEYVARFVAVNAVLFVGLFFFTTPIAMLGAIEEYTDNLELVGTTLDWLSSSSVIGSLVVAYIPSLFLLLLTFILPHILFFTTKLEGYHTRNGQNRAGLYKVFLYQLTAILILPSLALTSLEALAALSLDDLEAQWQNGALFPDGAVFVEYVIQAALIANACDIWRGPELLIQFLFKTKAVTKEELEAAEEVPPFKFGYEYQYFLIIFSVTLFYSVVVPVIVPCGLVYLAGKHFIDKYNLVYYYPKAPASSNKLTQIAIMLTMISLMLFQTTMAIYFYFYKAATLMSLIVVACTLTTLLTGIYINFFYFSYLKRLRKKDGINHVDGEIFRDAYLHPCFIEERRRAEERAKNPELELDTSALNLREFVATDPEIMQFKGDIQNDTEDELEFHNYVRQMDAKDKEAQDFAMQSLGDLNLDDLELAESAEAIDISGELKRIEEHEHEGE